MTGLVLLLQPLLLALATEAPSEVRTAAELSPRPFICNTHRRDPWLQSRVDTVQFCRALARGYIALREDPARAKAHASDAAQHRASAASEVLKARAALSLGEVSIAHNSFARAAEIGPESLKGVVTLHDRAVAASLAGHAELAQKLFRELGPQVSVLPEERRARAQVEAAMALFGGLARNGDARIYLGQVPADSGYRATVPWVKLSLVLFGAEAAQELIDVDPLAVASGLADLRDLTAPRVTQDDALALLAVAHELSDSGQALDLWGRYLRLAPQGAFRDRALKFVGASSSGKARGSGQ
ncbi:MAG: hypothetical protein RJA70_2736 [Pseudomonadota bacterium]|jgi:hypothetical protein